MCFNYRDTIVEYYNYGCYSTKNPTLYSGSNTTFLSVLRKRLPFSFKRKQKYMLLTCLLFYAHSVLAWRIPGMGSHSQTQLKQLSSSSIYKYTDGRLSSIYRPLIKNVHENKLSFKGKKERCVLYNMQQLFPICMCEKSVCYNAQEHWRFLSFCLMKCEIFLNINFEFYF